MLLESATHHQFLTPRTHPNVIITCAGTGRIKGASGCGAAYVTEEEWEASQQQQGARASPRDAAVTGAAAGRAAGVVVVVERSAAAVITVREGRLPVASRG